MDFLEAGRIIREARKLARLSQQDLATSRRMSRATISRIENGVFKEIGIRRYAGLLQSLGLQFTVGAKPKPPTLAELFAERKHEQEEELRLTDSILRDEMSRVGRRRNRDGRP